MPSPSARVIMIVGSGTMCPLNLVHAGILTHFYSREHSSYSKTAWEMNCVVVVGCYYLHYQQRYYLQKMIPFSDDLGELQVMLTKTWTKPSLLDATRVDTCSSRQFTLSSIRPSYRTCSLDPCCECRVCTHGEPDVWTTNTTVTIPKNKLGLSPPWDVLEIKLFELSTYHHFRTSNVIISRLYIVVAVKLLKLNTTITVLQSVNFRKQWHTINCFYL